MLIYNKNGKSNYINEKRAAIIAGKKGDAQDSDDGKKVWHNVGINNVDASMTLSTGGYGIRSQGDMQEFSESKEYIAINNALKNEKYTFTAEELAKIYKIDPEGVKAYLSAKNDEKLINDTYKNIKGKNSKYYLHMPLNGWEETDDPKGNLFASVTSDARKLLVNNPKGPRDMIDVLDAAFYGGLLYIGGAEAAMFIKGVNLFGFKNAVAFYNTGTLPGLINNSKSGQVENGGIKGVSKAVNVEEISPLLKTEPNTAFFWSGRTNGIGGADRTAEIAKAKGGVTLESTIADKNIQMPEWDFNDPSSIKAWEDASAEYARQVSGEVRAVVGKQLREGNIWENVELPRLKNNPNVTKIITIDPETGKETVIFER